MVVNAEGIGAVVFGQTKADDKERQQCQKQCGSKEQVGNVEQVKYVEEKHCHALKLELYPLFKTVFLL